MFSLRRRRLKGDMIEVFKMIHGIDKVNLGKLFCIDEDRRTRKHSLCFKIKRHVNSNIGLKLCTRRVINKLLLEPTHRCSRYLQILEYI